MVIAQSKRHTPEDLLNLPDDGKVYELINGEFVEKNVSTRSHSIGGVVYVHLFNFATPKNIGWPFPPDQSFCCFPNNPERVRKPDAAFVLADRLPKEDYDTHGVCYVAPDLLAEVVSPNDIMYDVEKKRDEWLEAGVQLVWVINPDRKTVSYHYNSGKEGRLKESDTLTAEPILPGFSLQIAELFKRPVR